MRVTVPIEYVERYPDMEKPVSEHVAILTQASRRNRMWTYALGAMILVYAPLLMVFGGGSGITWLNFGSKIVAVVCMILVVGTFVTLHHKMRQRKQAFIELAGRICEQEGIDTLELPVVPEMESEPPFVLVYAHEQRFAYRSTIKAMI